ncbi:hypothetical protein NG754_09615 [Aliarcobacter cryaerophilus]|uniref:hypothetical protein n=1 Tax=Aliarcobacter cryaerophilus TaxID=28198 RepID=UPI003DA3304A
MKKLIINTIPLLSSLTGVGRYCYEVSKYIDEKKVYNTTFHYGYNSKNLIHPNTQENIKKTKSYLVSISFIKKFIKLLISYYYKLFSLTYYIYFEPSFIAQSYITSKKKEN